MVDFHEFTEKHRFMDCEQNPKLVLDFNYVINRLINNETIDDIDSYDTIVLNLVARYYELEMSDLKAAEKYLLIDSENGSPLGTTNLGNLYQYQNKLELAEKYFLMGCETNYSPALNG